MPRHTQQELNEKLDEVVRVGRFKTRDHARKAAIVSFYGHLEHEFAPFAMVDGPDLFGTL
jgi:hypothetical protein